MRNTLIGAVCGDVLGSIFERKNEKSVDIELYNENSSFTDDTILTIAIADAILNEVSYESKIIEYGLKYPNRGYGSSFKEWLNNDKRKPYDSWGNGSAMRVSAISYAFNSISEILDEAKKSAECTHNHLEGIKGAQAVAAAIYLVRYNFDKKNIKEYIEGRFGYDLNFKIDEIRENYKFDVSCQGSVPQAIVAFLESDNYEHAIRLAISIGGDSDTIAAICGSIASIYYDRIPQKILDFVLEKLPQEFIDILEKFDEKYM